MVDTRQIAEDLSKESYIKNRLMEMNILLNQMRERILKLPLAQREVWESLPLRINDCIAILSRDIFEKQELLSRLRGTGFFGRRKRKALTSAFAQAVEHIQALSLAIDEYYVRDKQLKGWKKSLREKWSMIISTIIDAGVMPMEELTASGVRTV